MHYLQYTFYLKILDPIATTKLLGRLEPPPPATPSGDAPAPSSDHHLEIEDNVLIC